MKRENSGKSYANRIRETKRAEILEYLESLTLAHLVEAQSKEGKNREHAVFFLNDKLNQGSLAKAI